MTQRLQRQQLALRGTGDDFADAIKLSDDIAQTQLEVKKTRPLSPLLPLPPLPPLRGSQIDSKKGLLKDLTLKETKATKDKIARAALKGGSGSGLVPTVTAAALPHLSTDALAITSSLAEQLNNREAFDRAKTYAGLTGDQSIIPQWDCRVSPLDGISCSEFVMAAGARVLRLGQQTRMRVPRLQRHSLPQPRAQAAKKAADAQLYR